jgi:hypothetical protein
VAARFLLDIDWVIDQFDAKTVIDGIRFLQAVSGCRGRPARGDLLGHGLRTFALGMERLNANT